MLQRNGITDISSEIKNIIEKRQPLAKRVEKVETHLTFLQQHIQQLIKQRNNFLPELNDAQIEEIIENLAIQMIASCTPKRIENERRLNKMLDSITPEKLHSEIDFGEPVGCEIW
ncbi:MAG: hypothetical protein F6K23_01830 [Okeania sp. SIO2C9]|uniref:hypothetical protein n=1 Tax=Okeania sp. SIO2C9 TaxID=2607791 RepID=UPI0013BF0892|nr:hypothetical protein [Okeania sp. SIO2C9]NEQ71926.1 hypothetical protein [Okeania sp. SIO2C9]